MRGKYVRADIGGKMKVADELVHPWESLSCCSDERLVKIVHYGKGNTPIPAYILQDLLHFFAILRADFAAVQYLGAQRIQTHKEHLASFLTGTVDVQNVAAPMSHILSEEYYALVVNDLKIRYKLLRQVADRPFRNLSAIVA